ncbi:MAG: aminoglycoside phosphotransferase family protein [Fimbriimonadaceae bacterium]|nr:aminoglycoside phosphotransferase family protein [Fimbriimonadaceae bacterium]
MIRLPDAIAAWAEEHGFHPAEELPSGHCCRVWADSARVLRLPFQGEESRSGAVAAVHLSGCGGPAVHALHPPTGALLMERLRPGTSLAAARMPEDEAFAIWTEAARRLPREPIAGLLPLESFFAGSVEAAVLQADAPRAFLHGDLHHENILRSGSGWTAIDPKGLVGDPDYEPVAFLRNPLPWTGDPELIRRRLERLGELGWNPERVWRWAMIDAFSEPAEGDAWHDYRKHLLQAGPPG